MYFEAVMNPLNLNTFLLFFKLYFYIPLLIFTLVIVLSYFWANNSCVDIEIQSYPILFGSLFAFCLLCVLSYLKFRLGSVGLGLFMSVVGGYVYRLITRMGVQETLLQDVLFQDWLLCIKKIWSFDQLTHEWKKWAIADNIFESPYYNQAEVEAIIKPLDKMEALKEAYNLYKSQLLLKISEQDTTPPFWYSLFENIQDFIGAHPVLCYVSVLTVAFVGIGYFSWSNSFRTGSFSVNDLGGGDLGQQAAAHNPDIIDWLVRIFEEYHTEILSASLTGGGLSKAALVLYALEELYQDEYDDEDLLSNAEFLSLRRWLRLLLATWDHNQWNLWLGVEGFPLIFDRLMSDDYYRDIVCSTALFCI
uniref:Uncharacterized protein n=1 Tax=Balamuthia mandrillaris TaxID=66527 RepID=A0A0K1HRX9_9EUKA|nr:hypothetical protein [Balamuthia mandrillaris]AKT94894.1 hypothetical protein [Balamuthia mandrillaris]